MQYFLQVQGAFYRAGLRNPLLDFKGRKTYLNKCVGSSDDVRKDELVGVVCFQPSGGRCWVADDVFKSCRFALENLQ